MSGVILAASVYFTSVSGGADSAPVAAAVVPWVIAGIWCVSVSAALLDYFARNLNERSAFGGFCAQARGDIIGGRRTSSYHSRGSEQGAYGVYIIHPLIVVPVTHSYVCLLRAFGGEEIEFAGSWGGSESRLSSPGLLALGFVYTTVISAAICWPLAAVLRTLPGLRMVL